MAQPILSVVIPTWNRAKLVCEAIESALLQRAGDIEVIVVDDGSTDGTAPTLARRFGERIKLLKIPSRQGVGAARNLGVAAARGEWLAFLDSDDLWLAGKFDAELRVLQSFPSAEAIVSDSVIFKHGQCSSQTWFESNGLLGATQGRVRWLADCPWLWGHWKNTLAMCSITLRRDVLPRLGQPAFPEDLVSGEDWEWEMRVYNKCRVAVLPEVLAHVRRDQDDARPGRAVPGVAGTLDQQIRLLRDKLTILERTLTLSDLGSDVASEIERCRLTTAEELSSYEVAEA